METIEHIRDFLDRFVAWMSAQTDVHGIALVGSYARGTARQDSDIDLVVLTDQPHKYLEELGWPQRFGAVDRSQTEDHVKLISVRVWYQDGLEVEYGMTSHSWPSI